MNPIPLVDHDVPLPVKGMMIIHVCSRESSESNTIVRKFKSRCGNTLEVHVTRKSGYIRSIRALDNCQVNCPECFERMQLIRELIARERQSY